VGVLAGLVDALLFGFAPAVFSVVEELRVLEERLLAAGSDDDYPETDCPPLENSMDARIRVLFSRFSWFLR
jgi:hypothetical protein